jgi:hypothetical protein
MDFRYVLKNKETGKYIAVDHNSGGYPYDVDSIFLATLWKTAYEATRYTAVMSWKDYDNPLYEMELFSAKTMFAPMLYGKALESTRY